MQRMPATDFTKGAIEDTCETPIPGGAGTPACLYGQVAR
jgi:hypothetical protein